MIAGTVLAMGAVTAGLACGGLFCLYIDAIRKFLMTFLGLNLDLEGFYMLTSVPADCTWALLAQVAGAAFLVCVFSVWFPARKAVKNTPLTCFRYE